MKGKRRLRGLVLRVTQLNMKKYLGPAALGLVALLGLVSVIYWGVQPRPLPKIKLSLFQTTNVAANSILISLRPELQEHSLFILGIEPGQADLTRVLLDFVNLNQDPSTAFQGYVVDQELEQMIPELKTIPGDRFETLKEKERLVAAFQQLSKSQTRALFIMPAAYAATFLSGSPGQQLREQGFSFSTILLHSFPRRREDEKKLSTPCDVASHDMSGTGGLGCEILSIARLNYRKHFKTDDLIGLMSQVSQNDFLFLLAREP